MPFLIFLFDENIFLFSIKCYVFIIMVKILPRTILSSLEKRDERESGFSVAYNIKEDQRIREVESGANLEIHFNIQEDSVLLYYGKQYTFTT